MYIYIYINLYFFMILGVIMFLLTEHYQHSYLTVVFNFLLDLPGMTVFFYFMMVRPFYVVFV